MSGLIEEKCVACRADAPLVTGAEIAALIPLIPEWQMLSRNEIPQLERMYRFADFTSALDFSVKVGQLAESEGHHPAILTEWGRTTVTWWTHKIKGLHRNDFIMAAKTDQIYQKGGSS
jgi:4a-hydroxytetrahydrobiopterin dehydratase